MNRAQVLSAARVAGYHGDSATYTRLVIEHQVSRTDMRAAWTSGAAAKTKGVACDCRDCKSAANEARGTLSADELEIALCRC